MEEVKNSKFKDAKILKFVGKPQEIINEDDKVYYFYDGGELYKTANPALVAKYDARKRLLNMSLEEQNKVADSREYKKYSNLWSEADTEDRDEQEKIAEELNKLFR